MCGHDAPSTVQSNSWHVLSTILNTSCYSLTNPHHKAIIIPLLNTSYLVDNWGTERLSNLSESTQQVREELAVEHGRSASRVLHRLAMRTGHQVGLLCCQVNVQGPIRSERNGGEGTVRLTGWLEV